MGISINDLDGNLNLGDASLVSSKVSTSDRLRELLDSELKISGGEMKTSVFVGKNERFLIYGDGIDVYLRDVNDDITVLGDDITVYSDDKNVNVRKLRRVNRIVNDIEDLASQI